jgi:hypothetical protein
MGDVLAVLIVAPNEPITFWYLVGSTPPFEDVCSLDASHGVIPFRDGDFFRMWEHRADQHTTIVKVPAQDGKWIPVRGIDELL